MRFDAVYYEPDSLHYPLGKQLKEQYGDLPWFPIENHNRIEEMQLLSLIHISEPTRPY